MSNPVKQHKVETSVVVSVSNAALMHIKKQLAKQVNACYLQLGVKKSGCSGFKYVIDFTNEVETDAIVQRIDTDLSIIINKQSLPYLSGIHLDLLKEGLNEKLQFINPNGKDVCGCGESFSI